MGCGGSKSVAVRAASQRPSVSDGCNNTENQENEINVFELTLDNGDQLRGCYNAKPRLRSAIRRGSDIKPVTTELDDTSSREPDSDLVVLQPPLILDLTDHVFVSELPINRDSGFDSNRANSAASERAKSSVREETNSVATSVTMRPDSVLTGSVVTARDLNASFMTMSDDFMAQPNGDASLDLDTPLEDLHDFEEPHYRTLSNTPSRTFSNTPSRTHSNTPSARPLSSTPSRLVFSAEPLPVPLYPKNIDVIKEESEGGFTPRSILDEVVTPRIKLEPPKEVLPKYHSDEVLRHNQNVRWSSWGVYKGMIYDANKVINVFKDMHDKYGRAENERRKQEALMARDDESLDSYSDDDDEDGYNGPKPFDTVYPKHILNPTSSLGFAIKILLNDGIPKHVIEEHLTQCAIGKIKADFSSQYWDSFRKDVDNILEDLIRADLRDELSENTKDILEQLQRWIQTYRNQNPPPQSQQVGDPNVMEFSLPVGIRENPDCLRRWIESWEQFDLEIPETGPWFMYEVENIDLGDPQEIFEVCLRSNVDLCNPFITDVDGEAAWQVFESDIVANDIMTDEQRRTEESRRYRTDLHDPERMKMRRVKLLNYFVKKYEMDKSKINHFLQWSQAMEEGQIQFQRLCEYGY